MASSGAAENVVSPKLVQCPGCGKDDIPETGCTACEWKGCEEADHDFTFMGGEADVGVADCLECKDCGLQIGYDGRFDSEDL